MNAKPLKVVDFGELLAEHRRLEETLSRLAKIFRQVGFAVLSHLGHLNLSPRVSMTVTLSAL